VQRTIITVSKHSTGLPVEGLPYMSIVFNTGAAG